MYLFTSPVRSFTVILALLCGLAAAAGPYEQVKIMPVLPAVSSDSKVVLTKGNHIAITDVIDESSMDSYLRDLEALKANSTEEKKSDTLYVVLRTPGGSIEHGLQLIQQIKDLGRPTKTLVVYGASMGFITTQLIPGERLMVPYGTLMSHRAAGGFYGRFPGQVDAQYVSYLQRIDQIEGEVVARTLGKHTKETYRQLIADDFYCRTAKTCIAEGFADREVQVACASELNGHTRVKYIEVLFMGKSIRVDSVYPACPLTTARIKMDISINGIPLDTYSRHYGPTAAAEIISAVNDAVREDHTRQRIYERAGWTTSLLDSSK